MIYTSWGHYHYATDPSYPRKSTLPMQPAPAVIERLGGPSSGDYTSFPGGYLIYSNMLAPLGA